MARYSERFVLRSSHSSRSHRDPVIFFSVKWLIQDRYAFHFAACWILIFTKLAVTEQIGNVLNFSYRLGVISRTTSMTAPLIIRGSSLVALLFFFFCLSSLLFTGQRGVALHPRRKMCAWRGRGKQICIITKRPAGSITVVIFHSCSAPGTERKSLR